MIRLIREEFVAIGNFIRSQWQQVLLVSSAALFLVLSEYNPIGPAWVGSFIYFAALPILTIGLMRKNPMEFGLKFGNIRAWLFHVLAVCVVGPVILYIASLNDVVAGYYIDKQFNLLRYSLETGIYLFAWEFLFRGFLLFGLKPMLGESSIIIQMIPFALMHTGKPEIETISTVLTGIYFGYVAYRGSSFWPAFIMHFFINIVFMVFVNLR